MVPSEQNSRVAIMYIHTTPYTKGYITAVPIIPRIITQQNLRFIYKFRKHERFLEAKLIILVRI